MHLLGVLAVLLLVAGVNSASIYSSNNTVYDLLSGERDEDGLIVIGDLKLSEEQVVAFYGTSQKRGLGESREERRWPNGVIAYKLDRKLTRHKSLIKKAMTFWEAETCISFEELTEDDFSRPYVNMVSGTGCNSALGYNFQPRRGYQVMNLEVEECMQISTVVHELGHAIGLHHEMSRPDRDEYLNVFLWNTYKEVWRQFRKETENVIHNIVPYDFHSIMHYWIENAAMNENNLVVTPKDPLMTPVIERSLRPSFLDYVLVNNLYGCTKGCDLECMNGGLATRSTGNGCHCLCPYDTTGRRCERKIEVDECSYLKTTEGTFTPPNRNDPYDETPRCGFIFQAPEGKRVSLTFTRMDLDCDYQQFVLIRDSDPKADRLGGHACHTFGKGKELGPYISEENEMQILLIGKVSEESFEASVKFI